MKSLLNFGAYLHRSQVLWGFREKKSTTFASKSGACVTRIYCCRSWKSSMQCESFQSFFMSPSWFAVYVSWIQNFCLLQVLCATLFGVFRSLAVFLSFFMSCAFSLSLSLSYWLFPLVSRIQRMTSRRLFISVITFYVLRVADSPFRLLGVFLSVAIDLYLLRGLFTCTHMWHAKQSSARFVVKNWIQHTELCTHWIHVFFWARFNEIVDLNSFLWQFDFTAVQLGSMYVEKHTWTGGFWWLCHYYTWDIKNQKSETEETATTESYNTRIMAIGEYTFQLFSFVTTTDIDYVLSLSL